MPTAPGFADVSIGFQHLSLARKAFITFGVDPAATDPSAVTASVALAAQYTGSLLKEIDSQVTMTEIKVSMGTDGAEDIVYVATYTTVGGSSYTTPPPNVAALVHKTTGRGGRRGRGRFFLPWCMSSTDAQENGQILAAAVTRLNTSMGIFLTQLSTQGVPMVLLHGPGQTAPGAPNVVTGLTVDRLISTQRRRLGR